MTMSLFSRLQSYRPREERNPQEDFFTEAFCYILEKYPEVLKKYVEFLLGKDLLDIEPDAITIETQRTFGGRRPDVKITVKRGTGIEYLIICEHKLWAPLDKDQLSKYQKILEPMPIDSAPKSKYNKLVFIANYSTSDPFETGEDAVETLTWKEIYPLLQEWGEEIEKESNRELYNDFLLYMEELGMNPPTRFSAMDLAELCRIPYLFNSLDECLLGSARAVFDELSKDIKKMNEPQTQLKNYGRWTYHRLLVRSDVRSDDWFSINMGVLLEGKRAFTDFGFESEDKEYPELILWLESRPKNRRREEYKKICKGFIESLNEEGWTIGPIGSHAMAVVNKPITDFINHGDNQIEEIQKWFAKHLQALKYYLEENPIADIQGESNE